MLTPMHVLALLLCLPGLALAEGAVRVENGIRMVDASKLSVAELQALAAAARAEAGREMCCDWGGLGCVPHTVRSAAERLKAARTPGG